MFFRIVSGSLLLYPEGEADQSVGASAREGGRPSPGPNHQRQMRPGDKEDTAAGFIHKCPQVGKTGHTISTQFFDLHHLQQ